MSSRQTTIKTFVKYMDVGNHETEAGNLAQIGRDVDVRRGAVSSRRERRGCRCRPTNTDGPPARISGHRSDGKQQSLTDPLPSFRYPASQQFAQRPASGPGIIRAGRLLAPRPFSCPWVVVGTVTPCSDLPPHPGNMQVQMLTPISRRICGLTALRHSPVRLLVVFALGDRLC